MRAIGVALGRADVGGLGGLVGGSVGWSAVASPHARSRPRADHQRFGVRIRRIYVRNGRPWSRSGPV